MEWSNPRLESDSVEATFIVDFHVIRKIKSHAENFSHFQATHVEVWKAIWSAKPENFYSSSLKAFGIRKFSFPWLSHTPAPSPSVNRANQAHLRRPHLFHGTKIPETLAQTQTADWIPHFSPCTAHPMRSFKLETTFYVNASLKLYCLPIIFIGFAMHLWKRF